MSAEALYVITKMILKNDNRFVSMLTGGNMTSFKLRKLNRLISFLLISLFILLLFLIPQDVLARAGGGGGNGGGKGVLYVILMLVLLPFAIVYAIVVTFLIFKKGRESKALLDQIAKKDKIWDPNYIRRQVETVFFKVQEAWIQRDQMIAKDFVSQALFDKHKLQTDMMIANHEKNVMERINLIQARVVEVMDYLDDTRDQLWVFMRGTMFDYIADDRTGEPKYGKPERPEGFFELWKFVRENNNWVLDEIDQTVSISEMSDFHSFSEGDKSQ